MTAIGSPGFFNPIGAEATPPAVPDAMTDVAYASPLTINSDSAAIQRVVLTGGPTTINITGTRARLILAVEQDGVGNRTYTFGSAVRYSTDLPSFTQSTGANKQDKLGFIYEPNAAKFDLVAFVGGF